MLSALLSVPLNALIIVLMLPYLLVRRVFNSLAVFVELLLSDHPEGFAKSIELITSQSSPEEVLRAKFPNSIAVRS